jgi:hypothetical protein
MPPSTRTRAAGGAAGVGGVISSRVGGASGGGAVCAKADVAANKDSPMLPARAGLSKTPTEFPLIHLGPGAPARNQWRLLTLNLYFNRTAGLRNPKTCRTFLTWLNFSRELGKWWTH